MYGVSRVHVVQPDVSSTKQMTADQLACSDFIAAKDQLDICGFTLQLPSMDHHLSHDERMPSSAHPKPEAIFTHQQQLQCRLSLPLHSSSQIRRRSPPSDEQRSRQSRWPKKPNLDPAPSDLNSVCVFELEVRPCTTFVDREICRLLVY
jgi:hypothetical protein